MRQLPKRRPLIWYLTAFGAGLVLPALVLFGILLWQLVGAEREISEGRVHDEARRLAIALDRELAGLRSALIILSASDLLKDGELPPFHAQLSQAAKALGVHFVLRNLDGPEVLSTRVPFGQPVPASFRFAAAERQARERRQPVLSDLSQAALSGALGFSLVTPVFVAGSPRYLLGLEAAPERIAEVIRRTKPPDGWSAAFIDGSGRIVARVPDHDTFVGQAAPAEFWIGVLKDQPFYAGRNLAGAAVFATYERSEESAWIAAVGIDEELLSANSRRTLAALAAGSGLLVLLTGVLARSFARRIAAPIQALEQSAEALGRGEPVLPSDARISEVHSVGSALADASTALREAEQRLALAQAAGEVGIFDWDFAADRIAWGGQSYRKWGLDVAEIQPTSAGFYRAVHPDDRERVAADVRAALDGQASYRTEFRIVGRDGRVRWLSGRGEVVRDAGGRPVRMVGTNVDVTERRLSSEALARSNAELEEQIAIRTREAKLALERLFESQKVESIGALTGGVAHDFNNLLMVVLGNLRLLKKRLPDDPKAHRLLDGAVQGADRGATLTQRLLSFARRQELRPEAIDVPALVAGMRDLLQRSLGPTIRIETEFPDDLVPALVDANQLELAILNLAVNGRDAMPDGGALLIGAVAEVVTQETVEELKPGTYLRLYVRDEGTGMDEATLVRAREPFFTTKGVGKGTGLGLSMVQGLAAQSGGTLRLHSRRGLGTTVEIWLRAANPDAAAPASEPDDSPPAGTGVAYSILLVDDDLLVAQGTAAMLEDMGHHVFEASSGFRAMELLRSGESFDLVITDHAMPRMTGLDLARIARKRWPGLPVIIASGFAEFSEDDDGFPRLSKPYRENQLAEMIANVTRGRSAGPNVVPLRKAEDPPPRPPRIA